MSRLLVAVLFVWLWTPSVASAQRLSDREIAAQIEHARRLAAVDEEGCIKYPRNDEIVVCGENPDNRSQRVFKDRGEPDENRIRPGEAISTKKAAACLPGDSMCKIYLKPLVTSSFGYVPPVALDYNELMKGLPEPEMIVPEGSTPE